MLDVEILEMVQNISEIRSKTNNFLVIPLDLLKINYLSGLLI